MGTNRFIKPLVFIVIINLISVVLGGLLLELFNISGQMYVLPVVVAIFIAIILLAFVYRFFQPFEQLVQQFKKIEGSGQALDIIGNQIAEQICQSYNLHSQGYAASANESTKTHDHQLHDDAITPYSGILHTQSNASQITTHGQEISRLLSVYLYASTRIYSGYLSRKIHT